MRTPFGALCAVAVLGLVFACGDSNDDTSNGGGDAGTSNPDGSGPGTNPDGSDDQPNPDGGVSPSFTGFDINHVIITGQSNETGNGSAGPLSTRQPFGNLKFATGPMSMTGGFVNENNHASGTVAHCDDYGCTGLEALTSLVPLTEGDTYFDFDVETPASGFANQAASIATTAFGLAKHDILTTVDGRSGNSYACLRKGAGCERLPNYPQYGDYKSSYEQSMTEVSAAKDLAKAQAKSYIVRASVVVHGETDSDLNFDGASDFPLDGTDGVKGAIRTYTDALLEWQRDLESGAKSATGQTQAVPMFISQISNWGRTDTGSRRRASVIAQNQLEAHIAAPGKVILVAPLYSLPFADDCLHLTSEGERRLGEYFGKVYTEVVLAARTWEPVRPRTITKNGTSVTVQYNVPKPPLMIDTEQVAQIAGNGFTVVNSNGTALTTVVSAEVTAPDTITLTLLNDPGAGARLRYAMNQPSFSCVGPQNGARGNVRDSDTTPSQSGGAPLQNWGVHFDLPIP